MKTDLYIYYRVDVRHAEKLTATTLAMQRRIREEYGIVSALKRRPEEKNGQHTWMEVYLDVPPDFEKTLARAIDQAGLTNLIAGPRHTEIFLDATVCA